MASIFTGLAFMHGHIVDRKLVMQLGRGEPVAGKGATRKAHPSPHAEKARECDAALECAPRAC